MTPAAETAAVEPTSLLGQKPSSSNGSVNERDGGTEHDRMIDGARSDPAPTNINADLLALLEKDDRLGALKLCAETYGTVIGRYCVSLLGSQTEADDATQETFIAAHASLGGFRGEGSLRAWLLAIARRKCARHLERRARTIPEDTAGALSVENSPDEQALLHERARRARRALFKIRPSEREALVLRYAADLSYREVAEVSGIDEAAARKRVSRALVSLRQVLAEGSRR